MTVDQTDASPTPGLVLTPPQRALLQLICDEFLKTGTWPKSRRIAVAFEQGEFWDVAATLGWPTIGVGEKHRKDSESHISVEALAACSGTADLMALFIRALKFCTQRFRDVPEDPQVTGTELRDALTLTDVQCRQISELLHAAGVLRGGTFGQEPCGFSQEIGADAHHLRHVETLDDYLAIVRQEREERRQSESVLRLSIDAELEHLPPVCMADFVRARQRFADRDFPGTITSACGAVDALTADIYGRLELGAPEKVAFASKVGTVIDRLQVFERHQADLITMGMSKRDAAAYIKSRRAEANAAAHILQTLRRAFGDVHGTKPASATVARDAIQSAYRLCSLFTTILVPE